MSTYDFLIQTNTPMYKGEGATMGGTERQILTVAEQLAIRGLNVGIIHSETDGYDRIVNDVKHLNRYRHHYAKFTFVTFIITFMGASTSMVR